MFKDRLDAGRQLAALLRQRQWNNLVVLALPRGGVPVAAAVAEALGAPLGLLWVRKLRAPQQPELAVGAVVDGAEDAFVNDELVQELHVSVDDLTEEVDRRRFEMRCLIRELNRPTSVLPLQGKSVLLIDDGIATGATVRVAIRHARSCGATNVVVATPVASEEVVRTLKNEADDFISVEIPTEFFAVGSHYRDFHPVSIDEVRATLDARSRERSPSDSTTLS